MSEDIAWLRRTIIRFILIDVTLIVVGILLFLFVDLMVGFLATQEPLLPENFRVAIILLARVAIIAIIILGVAWEGFRDWEAWEKRKSNALG